MFESLLVLQHKLGVESLFFDWLKGIVVFFLFAVFLWWVIRKSPLRRSFCWGWGVHGAVTLFVMLPYETHYDLDAFEFFKSLGNLNDGLVLSLMYGNHNFCVLMSWLSHVPLLDSYHAQKVVLSFIGLMGSMLLIQTLHARSRLEIGILLFFPSLVFWSSIYSKDALVFFALCLLPWGFVKRHFPALAVSLGILFVFRLWLVVVALAALSLGFAGRKKSTAISLSALFASCAYFTFALHLFSPQQGLDRINAVSQSWAVGGSARVLPHFTSWLEVLNWLPTLIFASLFSPLPWQTASVMGHVVSLESLLLLIGVTLSLSLTFSNWGGLKESDKRLVVFLLAFSLFWSLLVGFLSYQNIGTSVRFRLQVLPFLLLLIVKGTHFWKQLRTH